MLTNIAHTNALKVTCGLILYQNKILICQRSESMKLPLKWEFPGGKVEKDELPEMALERELKEELALEIIVGQPLTPVFYDYGDFSVQLIPLLCISKNDSYHALEHKSVKWVSPSDLVNYDFAEADLPVVHEFLTQILPSI